MTLKGNQLNNLATFKAAAQFGSFTQAAYHLNVTTGAVSQQISLLEKQLAILLFERHSRGIKLTQAGQQIFNAVEKGLSEIESAIEASRQEQMPDGELRIKLTPSFAFKWLVPRLQNFYQQYPNITIVTFAEGALVDYNDTNFDIAIDYGPTPYPFVDAELLMAEQLLPVMSQDYADKFKWQTQDAALDIHNWQHATLLHDAMPWRNAVKYYEWQYYFKRLDLAVDSNRGYYFNRTDMAMAAAQAGLGIAMARYALVTQDFAQGNLISPCAPVSAQAGYYLISYRQSPAAECFKQWLRVQCIDGSVATT